MTQAGGMADIIDGLERAAVIRQANDALEYGAGGIEQDNPLDHYLEWQAAQALRAAVNRDQHFAEMVEALEQAVAYADVVARNEGMPAGKQAKRLTATAISLDGSGPFESAVFEVSVARALLSRIRGESAPAPTAHPNGGGE